MRNSSSFFVSRGRNMKFTETWIPVDDQVKLLTEGTGLCCGNADEHELPPYWMMVECATMGTLELLFSKVSPSARTAVASELGVKVPVFKNWLSVLRVTRNACCHRSRVWNREWGVCPKIPNAWSWSGVANGRTFAVLSVIYHLLARIGDAADPWRAGLENLLEDFQDIDPRKIGVPSD